MAQIERKRTKSEYPLIKNITYEEYNDHYNYDNEDDNNKLLHQMTLRIKLKKGKVNIIYKNLC